MTFKKWGVAETECGNIIYSAAETISGYIITVKIENTDNSTAIGALPVSHKFLVKLMDKLIQGKATPSSAYDIICDEITSISFDLWTE